MQKLMPAGEVWDFLWVIDFPLFEWSPDENKWNAMHHPFTRPKAEDMPLFEQLIGAGPPPAVQQVFPSQKLGARARRLQAQRTFALRRMTLC